jgi:cytosine/adenosine deaminase-related metal-dependent hydrolase
MLAEARPVAESLVLREARLAQPGSGAITTAELVLRSPTRSHAPYRLSLPDHSVLPGLVNAHEHLQLNAIPTLWPRREFANSYHWAAAFQPHLETPAVRQALALPAAARHWHGGLKNALCGATTVMHHDPLPGIARHPEFPARVLGCYGWAHSLHWSYGPDVGESYRSTPADVRWFIHLAEGTDEIAAAELGELESLGCLRSNTVLIHGVGLSEADVARLIGAGAALVWCPASNLAILGQTLSTERLRALFHAGRLALGTDSRLSGACDLLAELRVAADRSDFSARELLQLVTQHGRRLLGVDADNDVIIFRTSSGDPFADALKLHRADLRAVVRDGEPLITDPDFEEWFERRAIAYRRVHLDGRPKLCARVILGSLGASAVVSEPGLSC